MEQAEGSHWVEHSQELPTPATATIKTAWRKSTASADSKDGSCVEVALLRELVLVRDSKDAGGARLRFTPSTWTGFMEALR